MGSITYFSSTIAISNYCLRPGVEVQRPSADCALHSSSSFRVRISKLQSWGITCKPAERILPTGQHRRPRKLAYSVTAADVPDFLPATWTKTPENKPIGPTFNIETKYFSHLPGILTLLDCVETLTAEEATLRQLDALQSNDTPYPDHGVEVMYRFAGFDPFKRSEYFGPFFDLGQFERFRRIFHHSTYRVLLGHTERRVLSSLFVNEHCFKQRVWVAGCRPGEEEVYEFTLVQRVGGNWDGYWLTDSLRQDGNGLTGGIAY